MRGHVDEQTLAAFREGLLPARKAARITAHLAACQRCAEVDAQLAAVTTILAHTPAPPMPASLAARLDAALAAEIARSAAASQAEAASPAAAGSPAGAASPATADASAGAGSPAGTASPAGAPTPGEHAGRGSPGRAPWRLSLRLAAVGAAVVILAGGGYAVAHVLSAGNTGTTASSPGSSASHSAESQPAASGPAAAPVASAPAAGGLPLVASGTQYRSGHLRAQVGAVLRRYPHPGPSPGQPRAVPAAAVAAFPNLAVCVAHFARGEHPRLVDIARYGTGPAAVIVVPVAGTANVRVWVVGPGCSAQGGDVIAQFSMPASG